MNDDAEFEEFVESNARRGGRKCTVCALSDELLERMRGGRNRLTPVSYPVLSRYLETKGHHIAASALGSHFRLHEPSRP